MGGAPDVHYARSGDVSIAYQVFGEGDLNLLFVPGFFSHIELIWEHEPLVKVFRRLGSIARVTTFDRAVAPASRIPSRMRRRSRNASTTSAR